MATDANEKAQKERQAKKFRNTLERLGWIAGGLVLIWFFNLPLVFWYQRKTWAFLATGVSVIGFFAVYGYLQIYLPTTGFKVDYQQWQTQIPRSIQLATFLGVVCSISVNLLLWSTFGLFSPLVAFVLFMASTSFVAMF
ncbi:hypothetical protein EDD86DRAFT_262079 [Gorgonomyces haynaldii]|nr:hypothetical protein EDD86DRAFT_262079 [Gorgonomyces haynaldii]